MADLARQIVVGIDGSPPAERALGLGHAFTTDVADVRQSAQDAVDHALAHIDAVASGIAATGETVEEQPAPALVAAADGADLLVVGSRGRGGFEGLLLGSVSQYCTRHATCSVVVVR